MKWLVLAAVTAAIGNALPTDQQSQDLVSRDTTKDRLAKFDDLADRDYPTSYKGLNFSGVSVTSSNARVLPESPPNTILGFGDSRYVPFFSIDGTKTKSFDMTSFYIGFFDRRGGSILPLQFTVTGLNAQGGRHQGPILLQYTPKVTNFTAPVQKFEVGWGGLRAFYIDLYTDVATKARTAIVIDNIQYTTHK